MSGPMRDAHNQLAAALQEIPQLVGTSPKAILVISAHWEEPEFTVMTHPNPPMIYDYSGFPEHTYRVEYAAPGAPDLAEHIRRLLEDAGITTTMDSTRGFDHGVYAPMSVIYPLANLRSYSCRSKRGLTRWNTLPPGGR
jgi:aromatic ring-opening dioxygenase catalytic subunit (LigB family)